MKKKLISIIITVYNKEKYLWELLDSIFSQTSTHREIILIDDCSQDLSRDIAQSYKEKKEREGNMNGFFCYRNVKNLGLNLTTQRGCDYAEGERIMLADADDVWVHDRLEKQYSHTLSQESDLSYCDMFVTDEKLKITDTSLFRKMYNEGNRLYDSSFEKVVTQGNHAPATMLFKKELAQIFFPISSVYGHQDQWFFLKCLHHKKKVSMLCESLVYYRKHSESLLAQDKKDISKTMKAHVTYRNYFLQYTHTLSHEEKKIVEGKINDVTHGVTGKKIIRFVKSRMYSLSHRLLGIPSYLH